MCFLPHSWGCGTHIGLRASVSHCLLVRGLSQFLAMWPLHRASLSVICGFISTSIWKGETERASQMEGSHSDLEFLLLSIEEVTSYYFFCIQFLKQLAMVAQAYSKSMGYTWVWIPGGGAPWGHLRSLPAEPTEPMKGSGYISVSNYLSIHLSIHPSIHPSIHLLTYASLLRFQ